MKIPTTRAHAELEVPEVAEITYRSKHGIHSHVRHNPGVQLSWRGAAQQGKRQIRQGANVIFPVPGLYYVRASLASDDPEIDADGAVQNTAATKIAWVNVTSTGGEMIYSLEDLQRFRKANKTLDPLLQYAAAPSAAAGLSAQPAVIPICDPNDPSCEPPPPPGPSSGEFSGTLLYYNARLGHNVGLPGAKIAIFDTRGTGFNSVAQTDANGNFTLSCPPSYERGYLQMAASSVNTDVKVLVVNRPSMPQVDLGYWPDKANAAVDGCGTDTGVYMVGAPSQAEAFDNTSQTVTKSRQQFAVTRGPIGVNFVDGPQDSTLANYNTATDSITMHEGYATGSYGLFVAAHEYGHAVHEKALGPIIITPANASDPTCANHSYTLVTNYQCAYREGIADYQAVAVWGATLGDTLYPEFNNGDFAGVPVGTSYPYRPIGPSTEGAIASTLLHIGDGTGSRTVYRSGYGYRYYSDNVAFTHATVAAAIRDCSVILSNSVLVRADGIDYLTYCLEKPASYQSVCIYSVIGSPITASTSATATAPAAKSAASPANTSPPGCQPVPGFYSPNITQDERDKFAGLRDAGQAPAVQWQLGQWGDGVPQRNGYDQNVRTVWMCNLFFCS